MVKGVIFDFNRTLYDPDTGKLNDGALDLVKTLSKEGIKLSLLSKKAEEDRIVQICELGIEEYFMYIKIIEGSKTVPDFQGVMRLMHLYPPQIAVVGDRVRSEIDIGNQLGMTTFWYKNGKFANEEPQTEKQKPKYIITSLEELLPYIIKPKI